MSDLVIIPKYVAPREQVNVNQRVPRIIWQTMKTNRVPAVLKSYADTWINLNPEYEYRFFDNDDILNFIQSEFPDFLSAYNKIKYGASKADLWRYLVLYKYGGIYADLDCRCLNPLRNWIDTEARLATQIGINNDMCQWLIISEPGNPIFMRAANEAVRHIETKQFKVTYSGFDYDGKILALRDGKAHEINHDIMGLAGPPVLQEAAEFCLTNGELSYMWNDVQVLCVSDSGKSCQMADNVSHDSGISNDYVKALKQLKAPHYNNFFARMMRKIFPPGN